MRAVHIIRRTLAGDALDVLLEKEKAKGLNARDAAFMQQLTYQYFKNLGSVRRVVRRLIERPISDKAYKVSRILELGIVQLLYMRTDDHAAVDQTVEMVARLPHPAENMMKGMVNAVLRRIIREREDIIKFIERDPASDIAPWLKYRWAEQFGGKAVEAIGQALLSPVSIDITPKVSDNAKTLAKLLKGTLLPTGSIRLREATDVTTLAQFDEGTWWVQDMAAAIPATLFGNITDKVVADVCAAPGGKTMQLAARGAKVIAVDKSQPRIERLQQNLERTGLASSVMVQVDDATRWIPKMQLNHILLDAPCSATGTVRRNPDVQWSKSLRDVNIMTKLQAEILHHSFSLLPIGGVLVYCVCSLEQEEGRDQIENFLKETPEAKLSPIRSRDVGGLNKLVTAEGYLLCRPDYLANKGGMDGFFAARIERIG